MTWTDSTAQWERSLRLKFREKKKVAAPALVFKNGLQNWLD